MVPRISSSQNGRPGVTLSIQKQADASEVTVSDEVLKALPALERQFPDIEFQVSHVQSTFTEEQVEGVEHVLLVTVTERRTREEIDHYVDTLRKAVR